MNTERLLIKGKIEELKQRKMKLACGCDANIKASKRLLSTTVVTPLADIDLQAAYTNLGEALAQQREYLEICRNIETLAAELD